MQELFLGWESFAVEVMEILKLYRLKGWLDGSEIVQLNFQLCNVFNCCFIKAQEILMICGYS